MLSQKKSVLKIVLLGSGNVATQLGLALKKAGHDLRMVYSPTRSHAQQLARKLKCRYTSNLDDITNAGQVYLIAVKDDAIGLLAKQLILQGKIVIHTSGSTAMDVIRSISENCGVLYPLQTISKQKNLQFKHVPFCIEAANPKTEKVITTLAKSISANVHHINSEQRLILHLAAVFACNFSNYMYSIAETILNKHHLKLDILKPLIAETAAKINRTSPRELQTGPAVRGDKKTLAHHLKLLSDKKNYQQLYKLISENIIQEGTATHGKKF